MGSMVSEILIASATMSLDEFRWRWAAPELQQPDEYDMAKVVATKPSDIYGMGMVVYEVSPRNPSVPYWYLISTQVLTREAPFREFADFVVLAEVRKGKRPRKPANAASLGITESIWTLLGQCWNWEPSSRPDSSHVLSVLRGACQPEDATTTTPTRLKLKMNDVTISLKGEGSIKPFITLQYGPHTHTTSPATIVEGNKYTWYGTSLILALSLSHGLPQEER